MSQDNQRQKQLLDFHQEASNYIDAGKTKQQVIAIFMERGLPQELAESITSQGMIWAGSRDSYAANKTNEAVDDALFNHAREAAYMIDEGNSKEQIVTKFMALDMPRPIAEDIVSMGAELLQDMVKTHKQGIMNRGKVFAGIGVLISLVCYLSETETSIFYILPICLIILGAWVFSRGAKQTAARYPHWPQL